MSNRFVAVGAAFGAVLAVTFAGAARPQPTQPRPAAGSDVALAIAAANGGLKSARPGTITGASMLAGLAVGTLIPAQAVAQSRSQAAANGVTDYLSVVDRNTGAALAQSGAGIQVASESIMKLMLASYYLVIAGGYQHQSANVLSQLSYMIRYSDDSTANAYFSSAAVPTIAARYGMRSTINATDRVGHWGAVRITAADMTTFLYRAGRDPQVGPWLLPVMAQVAPVGSDGFNQAFGMNALSGPHGSKQGWGNDQFWSAASSVINSVGYTDRYYVAILQNSYSYPDPARTTSTYAARTIAAARPASTSGTPAPAPRDGDFVRVGQTAGVYRLAGGAPIFVSSWVNFGGAKPVKVLTVAQWNALRKYPVDGTFIKATGTGEVYRVAGQAPIFVSSWVYFGGVKPTITVDVAAINHAGSGGYWAHLGAMPVDGTFLTATTSGQVFRVVAGAPTFVNSWVNFGGRKPTTLVDGTSIARAGRPGPLAHLRFTPPEGTFITATGSGEVFRIAGGAPVYVSTWAAFGGIKRTQLVDTDAIRLAGRGNQWSHLAAVPRNGTFLLASGNHGVFRVAGGAPLLVVNPAVLGGLTGLILVDVQAVIHGGQAGPWAHLRFYPADGTFLTGLPGGRVYQVSGGHASYVPSWAPYGGPRPTVPINQETISRAGIGGSYNHLKR